MSPAHGDNDTQNTQDKDDTWLSGSDHDAQHGTNDK